MTSLLIGADPEFFVEKDGKLVSAYGLIEGTKDKPLKVNGGAVQVDGMALEFNIDPASTYQEFTNNIDSVLSELRKMVPEEYKFVFKPVAEFGKEYIDAQPEDAKRLGCDPDFNAYTSKPNPAPDASGSFRTASGHIHLGWTEKEDINNPEHIDACQMMVKQLDAVLGGYSLIWDRDNTRRKLYGKAGAYRPKPYGVEYRVMSNVWVDNPDLRKIVYNTTVEAFNNLMDGKDYGHAGIEDKINNDKYGATWTYSGHFYEQPGYLFKLYNELNIKNKVLDTSSSGLTAGMLNIPNRKKRAVGVGVRPGGLQQVVIDNNAPIPAPDPVLGDVQFGNNWHRWDRVDMRWVQLPRDQVVLDQAILDRGL